MTAIDQSLMQAAGFAGASAQQAVDSAASRAAINTNQLNLSGEQERRGISESQEASGMLRSSRTNTMLGEQTADQGNKQQLIDLGLNDTIAGANIDVMQEIARQQAQAEAMAQQRQIFDAEMALKWQELNIDKGSSPIDWGYVATHGGGTGPHSTVSGRGW